MSRYVGTCTWDDAAHLTEEAKRELWESIPPYQRDARSKGIPQLGSGAIYPVDERDITVQPFEIPAYWRRSYSMDVGWNRTACIWQAYDEEADTLYLYDEYYRGQAEPAIHAQAIKSRGEWIPGVIDPASRGRAQADGQQLLVTYQTLGLQVSIANNAVEAGLYEVWSRLSTGRLKVFSTLQSWFGEYRLYRRDENGKIVKENDHLMDTTRYLVMSGIALAAHMPVERFRDYVPGTQRSGYQGQYDPMAQMHQDGQDRNQGTRQREPWMPHRGNG